MSNMKNFITRSQLILFLSIAIPVVFFIPIFLFFYLNSKSLHHLGVLTFLDFNIYGASYAYVPAVFSYGIVGFLILLLWAVIGISQKGLKTAAAIFSMSGLLLIYIGAFSSKHSSVFDFFISVIYVIINLAGLIFLLVKSCSLMNKIFLSGCVVYGLCQLVYRLLLFTSDFNINPVLALCFLWYLYLFKYLANESKLNKFFLA